MASPFGCPLVAGQYLVVLPSRGLQFGSDRQAVQLDSQCDSRDRSTTEAMLVLVTGGASELGQAIAAAIRAQGHAVRLTDRNPLP